MEKLKPTSNVKQAWVLGLLVVIVSGLFGLIVLPRIGREKSAMEGLTAPDFALEVIHGGDPGNRIRLSDQIGKPVVMDFWASWCKPCREQAPIIDAFAKAHPDDVVTMGINTDDRREDAIAYAKSAGLSYPAVFDEGSKVASTYGVRALPTLVVIDTKGRIFKMHTRVTEREELEKMVADAKSR
ncbi:MAG: TlpA family protein disulfide reductase [Myxococcales bacterium]|nr:TlpA family protein disulfide reductase [Myxococcales bacterium]MCB9578869.1 TlpA family protein disulfide reductase [Polyangiaceae bacterium]